MTDMIPYVRYRITILACTSGGCSESPDGLEISTKEEGNIIYKVILIFMLRYNDKMSRSTRNPTLWPPRNVSTQIRGIYV